MVIEIEQHVADNYDAIVADEVRNVSYDQIAEHAEDMQDGALAAWARKRAAESGKKVTPAKATSAPKEKRAPKDATPPEEPSA